MLSFFANIFGYILNFLYELIKNYGFAIILFSILLKLLLLPMTIKQQKTLKKSQKVQNELKVIQEKYKNDKEKLNKEMMDLYRRENMSPLSGCFSSIIQLVLLLAMFYLVRNPLTYMKKIDKEEINTYKDKIVSELGEESLNKAYPEISIVKYINNKIDNDEEKIGIKEEIKENEVEEKLEKEEIIEEKTNEKEDEKVAETEKKLYINMKFLGLDLGKVPQENFNDIKVFIIPVLYIISSVISIKLMPASIQNTEKKENEKNKDENKKEDKTEQEEVSEQMNKTMTWMMPILAVSVSLMAPLGLALYWLVNNVLMIIERIFIDKIIIPKEEEENG